MRAYELFESNFELAEYGYWITDYGEIFVVNSYQGHYKVLGGYFDSDMDAFSAGWAAVIAPSRNLSEFNVEYRIKPMTRKMVSSLVRLIRDLPEYDSYIVDYARSSFYTGDKNGALRKIRTDFSRRSSK